MDKKILCVGLVCADLVCVCENFPQEDTDKRCLEQIWQRGGNASNNCTVLSLLGAPCEFLGTMAKSAHETRFLQQDFQKYGISIENCAFHAQCDCPLAVVILDRSNGSRTILAGEKNLPGISYEEFMKINLTDNQYKWIHFEGRPNAGEIGKMLLHIHRHNQMMDDAGNRITTSIELEKSRPQLDFLIGLADCVFIGKEFAVSHGYCNKTEATQQLVSKCRQGASIICAWGEDGAEARTSEGDCYTSSIFSPPEVVDTLGAGDTFVAATILKLSTGVSLQHSIIYGCQVAGKKCGKRGFSALQSSSILHSNGTFDEKEDERQSSSSDNYKSEGIFNGKPPVLKGHSNGTYEEP